MNIKSILVFLALVAPFCAIAQIRPKKQPLIEEQPTPTGFKLYYIISETGDTIPTVTLEPLTVSEARVFASKREERKWSRLKRDVAKVYPYSKMAGKKLKEYNEQLVGKSEQDQKRILKLAENDIKAEFEDDIRDMTLNQGRILIKLIDRETGNTSYGLVKDLRGSFQAVFWQSVARIFRTNLKAAYDPNANTEDRMIEDIILSIEDGTFVN